MASFVPCCKRNSWWSLNVKLFYVKIYKNITETAKTHNRKLSILLLSMLLCCMNDSSVSRTFLIHIQRTSNKMATPKTTPTDMELKITVGLMDMVGRVQADSHLILWFSLLFHDRISNHNIYLHIKSGHANRQLHRAHWLLTDAWYITNYLGWLLDKSVVHTEHVRYDICQMIIRRTSKC